MRYESMIMRDCDPGKKVYMSVAGCGKTCESTCPQSYRNDISEARCIQLLDNCYYNIIEAVSNCDFEVWVNTIFLIGALVCKYYWDKDKIIGRWPFLFAEHYQKRMRLQSLLKHMDKLEETCNHTPDGILAVWDDVSNTIGKITNINKRSIDEYKHRWPSAYKVISRAQKG